jgi:hypothetical protein
MADISHSQLLQTASHPAWLVIIDLSWSRSECLLLGFLLIAIVPRLHIFVGAGCSGFCGKLTGGSRASLSVYRSTLRTVPSWVLGGFPMFALPCSQPSDRPAPHPAVTSALLPRREPVTDAVSVFPLRASLNAMWFQVHARLFLPSPIEIVALYYDKPKVIRGAIQYQTAGGFGSSPLVKQCNISGSSLTRVGLLVSASDTLLVDWCCVARASRLLHRSADPDQAHAGKERVAKSRSVSSRDRKLEEMRSVRLVVSLTRFRSRRWKRMH